MVYKILIILILIFGLIYRMYNFKKLFVKVWSISLNKNIKCYVDLYLFLFIILLAFYIIYFDLFVFPVIALSILAILTFFKIERKNG